MNEQLTNERMRTAMALLEEIGVTPGAVFAYAAAIDMANVAKQMDEDDPDNAPHSPIDAICESEMAEIDDPKDEILAFWDDVRAMRQLIDNAN